MLWIRPVVIFFSPLLGLLTKLVFIHQKKKKKKKKRTATVGHNSYVCVKTFMCIISFILTTLCVG